MVQTTNHPKFLRAVFNNMLTFNANTRCINIKLRSRNAALEALARSSWGKDKEALFTTYKSHIDAFCKSPKPDDIETVPAKCTHLQLSMQRTDISSQSLDISGKALQTIQVWIFLITIRSYICENTVIRGRKTIHSVENTIRRHEHSSKTAPKPSIHLKKICSEQREVRFL